jgi:hypothetical protein
MRRSTLEEDEKEAGKVTCGGAEKELRGEEE